MAENRDGNEKVYAFESLIYQAGDTGGAYVIFPYNVREEFGRGRVKVGGDVRWRPLSQYDCEHGG